MDHKAFLAALPADVKTDLTVTGNGPGLRRLAAHGGLIVLAGALIAAGVPGGGMVRGRRAARPMA